MIGVRISRVDEDGPLFNGQAQRALRDFADDIEEQGAEWALRNVRRTHARSFKNPTGYYQSLVHISTVEGDPRVVDDGRVAYGPWLEGVGSRNNTTRFKGYRAFEKAALALNRRFEEMGEDLLRARYMRRIT